MGMSMLMIVVGMLVGMSSRFMISDVAVFAATASSAHSVLNFN